MCGIVGYKSIDRFHRFKDDLAKAAERLTHRGPDDADIFIDDNAGVGLAHRRLSVIDLSTDGRQPMSNEDGAIQIIYNGEVYNFKAIRKSLERAGHHFRSATDTEVILKAYQQWGIKCLNKFIGMFALAIYDDKIQTLFLARDRLGIKPLYYSLFDNTVLFASELKALMAFRNFQRIVDTEAIPLFLHYQYVPAPRTIFKNTFKLLPGQFLVCNQSTVRTDTFWKIPEPSIYNKSEAPDEGHTLERLEHLLIQAVSDRLISDVPLGALLSGGIDSSIVVALMQRVNKSATKTFSIGFKEPNYNEAPWAYKIANHLGTDHTEMYVTPEDALDVVPRLPDIYDEPFADSSAIPTFLVCKLARSQLTVALSGDGGDEQFAGYVRYWMTDAIYKKFQYLPLKLKKILASLLGTIPAPWVEKCYLPWRRFLPRQFKLANVKDNWHNLINQINDSSLTSLYRMMISVWSETELNRMTCLQLPRTQYEEIFEQTEGWPVLSRLMRIDQGTFLPDAMLTKIDRASMASSLEVRVPLLDHRLVEYTSTLPVNMKYRNGTGKYLLKKLLARYVPSELFERPKMGFGVPIDLWFRGSLKHLLLDYLSAERLKNEGLFDPEFVTRKIKEHLTKQANHEYRLWALLMWQMWREKWLGQ